MKKERIFYLDFVRAIAVISIILTHFNARYLYLDPPMPQKAVLTTTVGNLYIGDWGVSLFFIISGAALMYVYGEKCELKTFYKKRFLSLYPMFWIAYGTVFLYTFYTRHTVPGGGIPKNRLLFSLLGFDGLLATNGVATFYLLGEWFLGVIILLYLLFPLLRKLLLEKPVLLLCLTVLFYAGGLLLCSYGPVRIIPATLVFVRLPELVFGMVFMKYNGKADWKIALAALAVVVVNWVAAPKFSSSIQTTYVGIASFLLLVFCSRYVKCTPVEFICGILSKYSYAIFLIHHVVIVHMTDTFDLSKISILHSYLLFAAVCCVIAIFAKALFEVHRSLTAWMK